jgi:hypothetical protein
MAHVYEKGVWSSGNSRESSGLLHKSLTTTKRAFCKKTESTEQETEEAESSAPSLGQGPSAPAEDAGQEALERALEKCGYSKDLLEDVGFKGAVAKALARKGEIISQRTGRMWVERSIPEEPPAFVRPSSLKIGDRVQVLNWVPMGVHGAKIDLFPEGKVSKMYKMKCLVTKEPIPFGVIPGDDSEFLEEERVIGLELDGKGPYPLKEGVKGTPSPFITKDSTLIVRFPPMTEPSGQSNHNSPMIM